MEDFLLCTNCASPIGFAHKPLCLTKHLSNPILWKKTKVDDKFITFGMNFSFYDMTTFQKTIMVHIANACLKSQLKLKDHTEKPSLSVVAKSWSSKWMRGDKKQNEKPKLMKTRGTISVSKVHQPIFHASAWTPKRSDPFLSSQNFDVHGFTYNHEFP